MQGLVNLSTAIGDAIAALLPAACYLAALSCFVFAGWTLWSMAGGSTQHRHRPWVPFVSLLLSGVFASFPVLLTKANASLGTGVVASITSYAPTAAPTASAGLLGATPTASVLNVVLLFQYFFQPFGAACVFFAVLRWRAIVNGRVQGSPLACGVQFVFGVLCINVSTVAAGIVSFFA